MEKENRFIASAKRALERDGKVSRIGEYFLGLRRREPLFDIEAMPEAERKRFLRLAMR